MELSIFQTFNFELAKFASDLNEERAFRAVDGSSANVLAQLDTAIAQIALARTTLFSNRPFSDSASVIVSLDLSRHVATRWPLVPGRKYIY